MQMHQKQPIKPPRFRPLKTAGTLALMAFFSLHTSACTGAKTSQSSKIGGDSMLFQVSQPLAKAESPASLKLDSVPKPVAPEVNTLEHYYPYAFWPYRSDSLFSKTDDSKRMWLASYWRQAEDNVTPFELKKEVIDSYSPTEKEELLRRWEKAKIEIRVALHFGVPPSKVFEQFTPKEINQINSNWESEKRMDKMDDIRYQNYPFPR